MLRGEQLDDPRVFTAAHGALRDLHSLVSSGGAPGLDRRRVHDLLAELRVRLGELPQPDRVQVASPARIRARRFDAVFVCGLQEGEFPRAPSAEPFLSDEDRRAIAAASGLRLPVRDDQLERERYLFYVCISRAERLLALSARYCDEEGDPEAPSFFLEDAADLFERLPETKRTLSDVTWPLAKAPTDAERERALAAEGPTRPTPAPDGLSAAEVLAHLVALEAFSSGALERFADCPVKWLVEDLLHAPDSALEPDPEYLVRGRYAHEVLEATYRELRERTGSRRVTPDNLVDAEWILLEAVRRKQSDFRLSPRRSRVRAALRRLEHDLLRYLRHDSRSDSLFEPDRLELGFGLPGNGSEPVDIGGVRVRGRIDRVDTWNGYALVRDYKTGSDVEGYRADRWKEDNRLQAAVYMLAAQRLLSLEPAGGVYVPLGGSKRRPRGLVSADLTQELGSDFSDHDRKPAEDVARALADVQEVVRDVVERLRAGEVRPCPDKCAYRGGCSYPSICRHEE